MTMEKRDTILIVDDMEINRTILRGLFEKKYNLLEAENGEQALLLLEEYHQSIAVMILDVVMPIKNGYRVLEEVGNRGLLNEVPVVVITAENSVESEIRAFDMGASDIVLKPFEPHIVKRRVENIIELNLHRLNLEGLVEEQSAKLVKSNQMLIDTLSSVIEHRSLESGQHVRRIRSFTKILLEAIADNYPEYGLNPRKIELISAAASLHDIGKIAIPDAILNKPSSLTTEEFDIMKTHTVKGCEILAEFSGLDDKEYVEYAYMICRHHHERWDGRGYPDGLSGEDIPVYAQVVGIADAYDALTSDRVYKKAYSHNKAFSMILNGECGVFSPRILECFKNAWDDFVRCSALYKDAVPGSNVSKDLMPILPPPEKHGGSLDVVWQNKYFSLLRYINATVIEVDLDRDFYQIVYNSYASVEMSCLYDTYTASMQAICDNLIVEDYQERFKRIFTDEIPQLLDKGFFQKSWSLMVKDPLTGTIYSKLFTVLRVNSEGQGRRFLIIWKEMDIQEKTKGSAIDNVLEVEQRFLESFLGGTHYCKSDSDFTLMRADNSFWRLVGYTEEEFSLIFSGKYMEAIYSLDRERILSEISEQLKKGPTIEIEYRIVTKDGRLLWLLDKGILLRNRDGEEYFCCLLIDITNSKIAEEELQMSLERHRIIMEQTNDVIFEWDIENDVLTCSNNWEKKFGYMPIGIDISNKIPIASHIHPEDIPSFVNYMRVMASGENYLELEFRLANADGVYIWCRARASTQLNSFGKPIKAVGSLIDIDDEKRKEMKLRDQAERDGLTGLFNKSAARHYADRYLSDRPSGEQIAMMIVDLDNFKLVNDHYGHMFGDTVLSEVADQLTRLFRFSDIVARIGGDEFLIIIKNIQSEEQVSLLADRVIASFRQLLSAIDSENKLSCSIGISISPKHGVDFQTLFCNADAALYTAKGRGKDCFMVYNKDEIVLPVGVSRMFEMTTGTAIDSDIPTGFVSNVLIRKIFSELCSMHDLDKTIYNILRLTGETFNVSSTYIFENSPDGSCCTNTYEWCAEGQSSQKGFWEEAPYSSISTDFETLFNERGILYCPDVAQLPKDFYNLVAVHGVKALLLSSIRVDGKFMGHVGFDDCNNIRKWTDEEINILSFISELLSSLLFQKREKEKIAEIADNWQKILDNQDFWTYVVNPDNYQLVFVNEKIRQSIPDAVEGKRCYDILGKREQPCENCPMLGIKEKKNRTVDIYNSASESWGALNATLITWSNYDACLLACYNLSKYKN